MHAGRRLGNPLGRFLPENLPGFPPNVPFLDMRLIDKVSSSIRIWLGVPRFEHLTHLFKNGQYRQTKNIQFTPIDIFISFEVEDTGGFSIFTASIFRRDNPDIVQFFTELELTGIGINETNSFNSVQTITSLGGGWFSILMKLSSSLGDQYKLSFTISGGNTRVGAVEFVGIENGHMRFDLTSDMTLWDDPIVANGLTGSSAIAYDLLDGIISFHNIFKFIIDFDEQILGVQRSTFSAAISGSRVSLEGRELEARGILEYCPSNRIHLKWNHFLIRDGYAAIIIEISKDGAPYIQFDSIQPGATEYTTAQLIQGAYRFRLRSKDIAGNIGDSITFADFLPRTWFDPVDPANTFTDLAGTIQIENDQDRVARIDSKGSLITNINQPILANRPIFVYEGINHGAGIELQGASFNLDGSVPGSWIGVGQEFDIYMSVLLRSAPTTLPLDSFATTTYTKIFSFESFFELIAAKFSNEFFETPDNDYNTGYAIIARIYTGSGMKLTVLPIILEEINIIRASYDGTDFALTINNISAFVSAPGPIAPTDVRVWGEASPGKGIDGFVGPIITFIIPQPILISSQLINLLTSESNNPTAFIIPEMIIAPTGMTISFTGLFGTVSSSSSPSPSVTTYNLYHNNGTLEFPDFTVPAATGAIPGFIILMTPGIWRFVIRASNGITEDGNFENRLDITVIEDSPGILKLIGPQPNPVSQFTVTLKPNGFIEFSAIYKAFREPAIGNSVQIWMFEQNVPADFTGPPIVTMFIPFHQIGYDQTFFLTSTTVGPFSEIPHYAVARVMSDDGDFETRNPFVVRFTPDATKPSNPLGLKGNPC